MSTFEALLGLIAFCVFLAAIAQRLKLPFAVPLVLGGMGLALVPGLPPIELDPALIMALLLPPLLQISAYNTDWPAFKSNLRPILLLAIGAVFFTAGAVAVMARFLIPDMPWWAAIALGAIVAPPDAVAATSVLKQFRLPKRIVTVLEGESLINDASSLVLYRFAVAAVAISSVSYGNGLVQFAAVAIGGAVIGWVVGHVAIWVYSKIDDTLLDIAVSMLAGYGAYLIAESVHASGVLGAVACGLVLGRKQHAEFTARTRLELNAVWNFVEFLVASLAFMLIGLTLRGVVERLTDIDLSHLLRLGASIAAVVIVSRFAWVFASVFIRRLAAGKPVEGKEDRAFPWTHATVMSWAGMRGVVSIAAAIALPQDFPNRDTIVFLAFSAIFATLVLQGTTLGWLIKRLDVIEDDKMMAEPGTVKVRAELAEAALDAVRGHIGGDAPHEHAAAAAEIVGEYEGKAERAVAGTEDVEAHADRHGAEQRLRLAAIEAARSKLNERIDDIDAENHRTLGDQLDLEEQQVRRTLKES